jgi:L-cysteine desulfidase
MSSIACVNRECIHETYLSILKSELVPATGCTEPIAVALAAAKAREILGYMPERAEIVCSANIVKNVKGVTVPNTGGLKGIDIAAIAGIVGGDASRFLQVLQGMTKADIEETKRLRDAGYCGTSLAKGVEGLYIVARVFRGSNSAEVVLKDSHDGIALIERNGQVLFDRDAPDARLSTHSAPAAGEIASRNDHSGYKLLNIRDILEFTDTVNIADVRSTIMAQIKMNIAISDEGLTHHYGADVGKILFKRAGGDLRTRCKARAAAGSDARMGGCPMPVVINSGSGNQGMAVSLPVIEYEKELGAGEDRLIRALVLANLTAIHQKELIGKLSAYCGAVSAAVGAGAGITYLKGGSYEAICRTITNAIATIGGMVCDGAKASCAAKIASAVDAAFTGMALADEGNVFNSGEGLVGEDVETTIRNFGIVGGLGMKPTDVEIIRVMLGDSSV